MKNIQRFARWLKIFSIIFVLPFVCFDFVLTWFLDKIYLNYYAFLIDSFSGAAGWFAVLRSLPLASRILGMIVDGVSLWLFVWGFILFMRLLSSYQQGHVFSLQAFQLLRKISKIAFAWAAYAPINKMFLSLVTTLHYPPGHRMISVSISSADFYHIFFVGVLWMITSLIYEGYNLKKEQDLTV